MPPPPKILCKITTTMIKGPFRQRAKVLLLFASFLKLKLFDLESWFLHSRDSITKDNKKTVTHTSMHPCTHLLLYYLKEAYILYTYIS